ncbi:hypothetical protein PHYC_01012 [Phycisphaerales bacterium]|nr:hypothetical protein PHYC_01012 [Phycisphaerales bacterium]
MTTVDTNIHAFADRFVQSARSLGIADPIATEVSLRRRRRTKLAPDSRRILAMYEHNGILRWEEGVGVPTPAGRRRRRAGIGQPDGRLVTQFSFEDLPTNKIGDYLTSADIHLTANQGLFRLDTADGIDRAGWTRVDGGIAQDKRTLLFVHGTFSSIDNYLKELRDPQNPAGRSFLTDIMADYDQVLGFGHPTLSVSPFLNAVDLHRHFAGVTSEVHVISHSRGGLVTRWWLDGLGGGGVGPRKAVLVGSPMSGTGLASPARIRATMDLLTNVARGLELVGAAASSVLPFMSVATVLGRVMKAVTGTLANTPLADAGVALIPGLAGQSRVGNNFEIRRLRAAPTSQGTRYYTISSNFEPTDPGWKFWQYFRGKNLLDAAADTVFDGDNDLVVDTDSMNQLVDRPAQPVAEAFSFKTNPTVYHTNYFRQPETFDRLRAWFGASSVHAATASAGGRRAGRRRPRRST